MDVVLRMGCPLFKCIVIITIYIFKKYISLCFIWMTIMINCKYFGSLFKCFCTLCSALQSYLLFKITNEYVNLTTKHIYNICPCFQDGDWAGVKPRYYMVYKHLYLNFFCFDIIIYEWHCLTCDRHFWTIVLHHKSRQNQQKSSNSQS